MKKNFMLICIALILAMTLIVSCDNSGKTPTEQPAPVEKVTVTFDPNGGGASYQVEVEKGKTLPEQKIPTREGYDFLGWTIDGDVFNLKTPISKNITLKALWGADVGTEGAYVVLNQTQNIKYKKLNSAFDNTNDGDILYLLNDLTSETGYSFNNNVTATFDLNGKTLKVTNDTANSHRAIKITAGTLTIKNGTIDARNVDKNGDPKAIIDEANKTNGNYGTIRVERADSGIPAKVVLEDLALYNNHFWGMSVKVCKDDIATITNCTFNSSVGGCIEAEGGNIVISNSTFNQTGTSAYPYISSGICVSYLGKVEVNNTSAFNVSGAQALYVFSSGGEIIVNDGVFKSTTSNVVQADFDNVNYSNETKNPGFTSFKESHGGVVSIVTIKGGCFEGSLKASNEFCKINITGGTFTVDPSSYVPKGYTATHNADGTYTVTKDN